jgi:hypothetical protein
MTENQWPADPTRSPLDQYGNPVPTDASAEPETYVTTKDAAKQEASKTAEQAAGAARSVAQTAKAEAGHVATEAKSSAQGLLQQAKSGLGSKAGEQQRKAADGIRGISSQLQTMADAPEEQGVASDLVREVAGRASSAASWIEGAEPQALLDQVQSFARRKPGTFLLGAAVAGVLAGRLTSGVKAAHSDSSTSVDRRGTSTGVNYVDPAPVYVEETYVEATYTPSTPTTGGTPLPPPPYGTVPPEGSMVPPTTPAGWDDPARRPGGVS